MSYVNSLFDIFDYAADRRKFSNLKPAEWNEMNRVMSSDVSPFPGPFSYKLTPYLVEIVNRFAADDPARIIAFMKGAQVGASTGLIEAAIGWIISQSPGNILFLTGHDDLAEEAMNGKIDQMIDSCGLRPLIRPNVIRKKNQRTGDTSKSKEFPGGSLTAGGASNHKLLRQRSVRYGFMDDFEAVKGKSKESGSSVNMIEQRFAAYYDKMKLAYISTPEVKQTSNIEPLFLKGDQRYYNIPCPCCSAYIPIRWSVPLEGSEGREMAGIIWEVDAKGRLVSGSVRYRCQLCGGYFDDSNKLALMQKGMWVPTAEPSQEGFFSYHLSSLYAPPGMYDWEFYTRQYLEANPPNAPRIEEKHQAFLNLSLGETYEVQGEAPKASEMQKNVRDYSPWIVPEKLSMADGNGRIVLLTFACDMNGTVDDARLDYEITAYAASGATYSIAHGSIGTFVRAENQIAEKDREDRERWTYRHVTRDVSEKSVWQEVNRLIEMDYKTDTDRDVIIAVAGVDCGYESKYAYQFIDGSNLNVVGIKGRDIDKNTPVGRDAKRFSPAKEREKLYLADVNKLKDDFAEQIKLQWNPLNDDRQPSGFMNFPIADGKLYQYNTYYSQFEAEHKVQSRKGEVNVFRWVKKDSKKQNHFFDCFLYNMVLKDIFLDQLAKSYKEKSITWKQYVEARLVYIEDELKGFK